MLEKDTVNTNTYRDSLAYLYFLVKDYPKCLRTVSKLLDSRPEDLTLLEMAAISYKALGNIKQALGLYETIYALDNNVIYLYQIAELQFFMKRYYECNKTLKRLLETENIENVFLTIAIDQNTSQRVPIKSAALNINGLSFSELKENEKAKRAFKEALSLFQDFVLPHENLKKLNNDKQ